jgi:hypothetical protein
MLIDAALHEDPRGWLPLVSQPVLVYVGKMDATAHYELGRKVAATVQRGVLVEDEQADHFAFYNDASVLDVVKKHVLAGFEDAASTSQRTQPRLAAQTTP